MKETVRATLVHGSIDEANTLMEQAQLPHNSGRQRFELARQAVRALTSQLGSPDYFAIGEIFGGGSARSSQESLEAAFCKKAASRGGDVVLIFRSGIEEQPFVYTSPSYSTTNAYGSAYAYGNRAYGSATAHTTYMPGHTYSGVLRFPVANGMVFKYVPGAESRREAMAGLNDESLERIIRESDKLRLDETLSFDEVLDRLDQLLAEAKGT